MTPGPIPPLLAAALLAALGVIRPAVSAEPAPRVVIRQFTVTAYCPCRLCCGRWADGITASGAPARAGVTAAGPRALPFGTRVRIPGVGERVIQDRLAARYDARLDVYFETHAQAAAFGRREARVIVSRPRVRPGSRRSPRPNHARGRLTRRPPHVET